MKNRHVLVVDDDRNMRDVMSRLLERRGYTAFMASSAQEACDILGVHAVDGIILNPHLRGMSGKTLFHAILGQWPELRHRIAVVTEDPDAEELQTWLEVHDLPVLTKPFRLIDFSAIVETITAEERREVNGA